jgi:RNA polymerase sigma-70 factor (ECF subfamily)
LTINDLYTAFVEGDKSAEGELFQRLSRAFLYFVSQRIEDSRDAEEVVQETLLTIAGKFRSIDITSSFSAWAYKILEFKLLHYYRHKRTRDRYMERYTLDESTSAESSPDHTLRRQLADCLRKINRVNNRYARILNLRYQGYSTNDIVKRLRVTPANMHNILSRARSMLRLCLEKGLDN